jgi:hypothetical protein
MPHFKAGVQYRIAQTCHFLDVTHCLGFTLFQKHTVQRKSIIYVVHTNGRLSRFSLVLSIDVAAVGNAFPKALAPFLPSIHFNPKEDSSKLEA